MLFDTSWVLSATPNQKKISKTSHLKELNMFTHSYGDGKEADTQRSVHNSRPGLRFKPQGCNGVSEYARAILQYKAEKRFLERE